MISAACVFPCSFLFNTWHLNKLIIRQEYSVLSILSDFKIRLELHGVVRLGVQSELCAEQDIPKSQQRPGRLIFRNHHNASVLEVIFQGKLNTMPITKPA